MWMAKRRLELKPGDPQDLQDGGWPTKTQKTMVPLSHTRAPAHHVAFEKARCDTSLGILTQRFADMLSRSVDGVLDLNIVAQELNAPKRRVYDVTNVLEGIHLIKKKSKNFVEWMGGDMNLHLEQELKTLVDEESRLDELIQSCTWQVHRLCENSNLQRFAYLTYEDVQRIPSLKEQTVIVIKAPAETKLEVPHPDESLQVHLSSTQGPIEAFLCSDAPIPMDATEDYMASGGNLNSSHNRNSSVPLVSCSSFVQMSSKDNAIRTSAVDSISTAVSKPKRHSSPVTVTPVSPMHISYQPPSEDQQSFVNLSPPLALALGGEEYLLSLADDEGITDLFTSFDLDQMPIDTPL